MYPSITSSIKKAKNPPNRNVLVSPLHRMPVSKASVSVVKPPDAKQFAPSVFFLIFSRVQSKIA